jgi:hypothetical protein
LGFEAAMAGGRMAGLSRLLICWPRDGLSIGYKAELRGAAFKLADLALC